MSANLGDEALAVEEDLQDTSTIRGRLLAVILKRVLGR